MEAASDVLMQVQDNLMPAYEKQLFDQVHAQLMAPYQLQIQKMMDAFRIEVLSTQEALER